MKSVSIVCANYNKGDAVAEAIESFLLQQTSFPVEIIVVDDASTDGSKEIVRYYCENYPDRITGIFNDTHEGMTKILYEACKMALGDYIALCDAGDYWIDPSKLQKQVDLLESMPDSQWSDTDFDREESNGEYVHNVLAQDVEMFIEDFADALIKQVRLASSTWLVDADLMRKANEEVRSYVTDDLLNLQLELFKHTKRAYLPDSTTVVRPVHGSGMLTKNYEDMKQRIESLCDLQLEYIESEEWLDYKELSKRFARWLAQTESMHAKEHIDSLDKIERLQEEIDRLRSDRLRS